MAELLIEAGHPGEAEAVVKEAKGSNQEGEASGKGETLADAVLLQALVAQERIWTRRMRSPPRLVGQGSRAKEHVCSGL